MSEKPISPLRRRMIEDMTVRNFVKKTHNDYIRHVRTFTTIFGRAPDTAAPEDLRLFQPHWPDERITSLTRISAFPVRARWRVRALPASPPRWRLPAWVSCLVSKSHGSRAIMPNGTD